MSKFKVSKIKNKQGTEINPPPIPKRPAKKPTAVAAKIIRRKKYQYSFIRNVRDRLTYFNYVILKYSEKDLTETISKKQPNILLNNFLFIL